MPSQTTDGNTLPCLEKASVMTTHKLFFEWIKKLVQVIKMIQWTDIDIYGSKCLTWKFVFSYLASGFFSSSVISYQIATFAVRGVSNFEGGDGYYAWTWFTGLMVGGFCMAIISLEYFSKWQCFRTMGVITIAQTIIGIPAIYAYCILIF
jgi:hypothetical protein